MIRNPEGYGMGPLARRILWDYWDRIWLMASAVRYYGAAFKCFQGVAQGYPLSNTI